MERARTPWSYVHEKQLTRFSSWLDTIKQRRCSRYSNSVRGRERGFSDLLTPRTSVRDSCTGFAVSNRRYLYIRSTKFVPKSAQTNMSSNLTRGTLPTTCSGIVLIIRFSLRRRRRLKQTHKRCCLWWIYEYDRIMSAVTCRNLDLLFTFDAP